MSRFPYTESADAMRLASADWTGDGAIMSRAQASRVRQYFAAVLGMDDAELAAKVAIFARENPNWSAE